MSADVLIKVEGVSKKFCRTLKRSLWYGFRDIGAELVGGSAVRERLRTEEFWAVDNASFEVCRGECLGLIGANGAGKTTLLKMLNGLIRPDRGRIAMKGRVGALIALGAGFNPILTGRENVYVNGAVLGLSKREVDGRLEEIIDFAEIRDFIDTPVQYYSSGMQVRLGFAIATSISPDVLLLDEVLAVGDVAFRGKCFKRIGEIMSKTAVVFVSHNEAQVLRLCNKALLLKSGVPVLNGDTIEALRLYRDQQKQTVGAKQLLRGTGVVSFDVLRAPVSVPSGGSLEIDVSLGLAQDVSVGFVLVHLAKDGEFVANSEWRTSSNAALRLTKGTHMLSLVVGPLHLVYGSYSLSFSIFDASCKNTILQAFHFLTIEVTGPLGSGPVHLVPMKMTVQPQNPPEPSVVIE